LFVGGTFSHLTIGKANCKYCLVQERFKADRSSASVYCHS
jgi:hypothetical protein